MAGAGAGRWAAPSAHTSARTRCVGPFAIRNKPGRGLPHRGLRERLVELQGRLVVQHLAGHRQVAQQREARSGSRVPAHGFGRPRHPGGSRSSSDAPTSSTRTGVAAARASRSAIARVPVAAQPAVDLDAAVVQAPAAATAAPRP